jgi:hypothetical protein
MSWILLRNFFWFLQNLQNFVIWQVLVRLHRVLGHEAIWLVASILHRLRATHVAILSNVCENIVTILSDILCASIQLFEILLKFFLCHQSNHAPLNSVVIIRIVCICSAFSQSSLLLLWRWCLLLLFTWGLSMLSLFGCLRKFLHWIGASLS